MGSKRLGAVVYALLAAIFYALNVPMSKILLREVPATMMAAMLYLGAGAGVGIMYCFHYKGEKKEDRLGKSGLPYTIGMVALDILAPILLMLGLQHGTAANASLLGNFEIVATTLIALMVFNEAVSKKLWLAILLITVSSMILSFEGDGSLQFSSGSILVLLATACWGLENNCTRRIADKSTYQIVTIKGLCSGAGSLIIAAIIGEKLPALTYIALAMLLGFVAYGLSIFMYVRAQRDLGAAKTSAYYAAQPFVGAFLSFAVGGERLTWVYLLALGIMIVGTAFVVWDTVVETHEHPHEHDVALASGSDQQTGTITHTHSHTHLAASDKHTHRHKR